MALPSPKVEAVAVTAVVVGMVVVAVAAAAPAATVAAGEGTPGAVVNRATVAAEVAMLREAGTAVGLAIKTLLRLGAIATGIEIGNTPPRTRMAKVTGIRGEA